MEINFNKINERLHNGFPFSRTNLIIRDESILAGYSVELIVDDRHVKRIIPRDELLSLSEGMAKMYWEAIFNNLITTLRGYREDQNGGRKSGDNQPASVAGIRNWTGCADSMDRLDSGKT